MREELINVRRPALSGLAVLMILSGVVCVTLLAGGSVQRPAPASAAPRTFSAERAMQDLSRFADRPRPMGSPASDRTRRYLVRQLRAAGFTTGVEHGVGAHTGTGLATFGRAANIVAARPGTDSTGTLLLAAHYDSAATGPGAADDGAAVAAVLETARALRAAGPLRNDLVLLLTDGEEDGLLGADAYVRAHPLGTRPGVALNWEARGTTGPSLMFETSTGDDGLVSAFTTAAPHPRGASAMVAVYRMLPNDSDFTALRRAGFAGLNFAFIDGASHYHTAADDLSHLDPGSLQHHGENMVALTRALGATDLRTLDATGDRTYFTFLTAMISYPGTLNMPLAIAAVLLTAGLIAMARRRRLVAIPRVLLAAASAVVPLTVSAALGQALWPVLVALRPEYEPMLGLVHRPAPYQLTLAAVTAAALAAWYLPLRRRLGPAALALGALMWPAALGVLCAATAPGAAYLFALPTLCAALGTLIAVAVRARTVPALTALVAGAVPATALLPEFARLVLTGTGLPLGGAGAVVFAVYGLVVIPTAGPLVDRITTRRAAIAVPLTAAITATALVAGGLATDRFDPRHPARTHLSYVLDAGTRHANWVSADTDPGPWTRRYVRTRTTATLPAGYARGRLWTGPARALPLPGPALTVHARTRDTATFHVRSRRAASRLTLRIDHPVTHATVAMAGHRPVTVPVDGTRAETWPGEIRLRGLPPRGAGIKLRVPHTSRFRVTVIDETHGLTGIPGYTPRPPGLIPTTREDGDLTSVTRTFEIPDPPGKPHERRARRWPAGLPAATESAPRGLSDGAGDRGC